MSTSKVIMLDTTIFQFEKYMIPTTKMMLKF